MGLESAIEEMDKLFNEYVDALFEDINKKTSESITPGFYRYEIIRDLFIKNLCHEQELLLRSHGYLDEGIQKKNEELSSVLKFKLDNLYRDESRNIVFNNS